MPPGPLSRYRDLTTLTVEHETRGTTRTLAVRRRPSPPVRPARRHRVAAYESLDLLARRYLGREDLGWRLSDANGGRMHDELDAGELLDIPSLASATRVTRFG